MKDPQAPGFEQHARDLYLRAGPHVDPGMAARLRVARYTALDRDKPHRVRWMVPASACAAAVLAVVLVWQPLRSPATIATMSSSAETAEALPPDADQTDPGLYQNLGFYAWLAQQPAGHQAAAGH